MPRAFERSKLLADQAVEVVHDEPLENIEHRLTTGTGSQPITLSPIFRGRASRVKEVLWLASLVWLPPQNNDTCRQ